MLSQGVIPHPYLFPHLGYANDLFDKRYINASIEFCKTLNGKEKSEFISEALAGL